MEVQFTLFGIKFSFIFRHKWDKISKSLGRFQYAFSDYSLGITFKKRKFVGKRKPGHDMFGSNLINSYFLGIDLIICKLWFEVYKDEVLTFDV